MKLTVFFLTAAFLNVSANGISQNVTFSGKNVSLESVFSAIEKQTDFVFAYERGLLNNAKEVTVSAERMRLQEFLKLVLKDQPFTFVVKNKTIIVSRKPAVVASSDRQSNSPETGEFVASTPIRGRVLDSDGQSVSGVTITVKNSKVLGVTDAEGFFTLNVTVGDVLIISSVAYDTREVVITADLLSSFKSDPASNLIINLKTKISTLENVEVVYNGYQDIPKERATGSFVKIDNELLNRKVSPNVLDRIFDVTSGLIYAKNTSSSLLNIVDGLPSLQIRGASTINANKIPLIVVDNFPYQGSLEGLNPNDIESITVLKDAAASSIWGIQSGNGVIVITTKKGKFNQRTSISINSNVTLGMKPDLFYIPTLSSTDVIAIQKDRFADSTYNAYDDLYPSSNYFPSLPQLIEILLAVRKGTMTQAQANTHITILENSDVRKDINKYLLRNSIGQQYALNISGGGSTYNYYGSIGYDRIMPIEVGAENKRYSFRMNSIWKPIKGLEISGDINYIHSVNENAVNDYRLLLPLGNGISPYTRLADENGNALAIPREFRQTYIDTAKYPALLDWHYRPLDELKHNLSSIERNAFRISPAFKYTVLNGLKVGLQYQYLKELSNGLNRNLEQSYTVRNGVNRFMRMDGGKITYPWPIGSVLNFQNGQFTSWNLRLQAEYSRTWGNHSLFVIAGSDIRESKNSSQAGTLIGFNEELSIAPVVDFLTPFPSRPDGSLRSIGIGGSYLNIDDDLFRNGSYFSNAGYSFNEKYLLNISARIDQSNLFGVKANQRSVPLWSTGLGWLISSEPFFNVKWANNVKIRATYGFNGNASNAASAYPIIEYRTATQADLPSALYGVITTPNNPQLRWERIKMINFGIDFSILNRRIEGNIEYYLKNGLDLLGNITNDPTTGWGTYFGNFASIKANGFDANLNVKAIDKQVKWNIGLSLSTNTDKVTDYGGQSALTALNLINGFPIQVGRTLYALNSYRWSGLDPVSGTPRIVLGDTISNFVNFNKGNISDVVYHGSRSPRVFGYILNSFTWNNLTISCNITVRLKYFFRRSTIDKNSVLTGGHVDYLLRWQKPGDEQHTNVPAYGLDSRYQIYSQSDILVERGDHIRLQDVRVSYDVNKHVFKKLPFQNMQFYFYAQNLGIIWRANDYKIDPDAYSFGQMPAARAYSLGITFNY